MSACPRAHSNKPGSPNHGLLFFRNSKRSLTNSRAIIVRMAFALTLAMLPSCATNPKHPDSTGNAFRSSSPQDPLTPPSDYWVLVSEDPITFHPKGMSEDIKTDRTRGEWVEVGAHKTRFFIPRGGVENRSEHQLMEEAFSVRSGAEKRETKRQNVAAERRKNKSQKPSFADRLGYDLLRHHALYSRSYQQQSDQAWLDRH